LSASVATEDGLKALKEFCEVTETPYPTAIIDSGNGFHVYWISDKPLSLEEWRAYAAGLDALAVQHGLLHDSITTDAARILRVPGTSNNKQVPPKPVKILLLEADLSFASALSHLLNPIAEEHAPAAGARVRGKDDEGGVADPTVLEAQQAVAFEGPSPDEFKRNDFPPLPFKPIQEGCPFFADAYETHGKGHDQPLWHLTVLATTFMENGEQLARALGSEHPDYSRDTTQEMWDRKVREREDRSLGWPGCQAFEDAGCTFCKTCKHHGKIKSPLNLAVPVIAKRDLARVIEEVKEGKRDPVVEVRRLHKRRAGNEAMFAVLNVSYAVVRYGGEIVIANIIRNDIILMKVENFHKMYANVRVRVDDRFIEISRLWFNWRGRRQYLDRGIVFEPGSPLEVPDDRLNLWRGFGIKPTQGAWPLLRSHLLNVVCSGNQAHFDYLIRWMAYAVQRPNEPIGVAVAFRGAQGAGKGVVARTLGKMFGKHFAHIANGEQLTGRFNASLATSCLVFLDEALWAGDKKGEGVLKALITEPRLQLEAKFRDPIMVDSHTHIVVASNNDWFVPAGMGDRRWFILDVADTYAGTGHREYWEALYAEIDTGGAEAMFYELLNIDLSTFNVRAVPHTAAKAHQQAHSLRGVEAWVHHILQEGAIGTDIWREDGLTVSKEDAYKQYLEFSKEQRDWRPDVKSVWSRKLRDLLGSCVEDTRQKIGWQDRVRAFRFAPLGDCRHQFALCAGAPNMEWEPTNEEDERQLAARQINQDADTPAKLNTLLDAPLLAPESDADLRLPSKGAAGQGNESGSAAASLVPDNEPVEDELDGAQWEQPEGEPIEEEPEEGRMEPRDDEADDA
jgi:hypothetical protein